MPRTLLLTIIPFMLQVAYVLSCAHGDDISTRIFALFKFDSYWFETIARNGYLHQEPMKFPLEYERNNVAFFPGYSLAAALLSTITGLSQWISLLVCSFTFAGCFWFFLARFALLRNWPYWIYTLIAALVIFYPGSFFMLAAYAESMMLAFGLAFLCECVRNNSQVLYAGVYGFLALLAHIRGLFFLVPAVTLCLQKVNWLKPYWMKDLTKQTVKLTAIVSLALLAPISFYTFCWIMFDNFWLMEETTKAGWYHRGADLLWPFTLSNYTLFLDLQGQPWYAPNPLKFGQLLGTLVTILLPSFLIINVASYPREKAKKRYGIETYLYLSALIAHYGVLAAMATNPVHDTTPMYSSIRYGLTPWIIFLLALGSDLARPTSIWLRIAKITPVLLTTLPCIAIQWYFIQRFTRGIWVS